MRAFTSIPIRHALRRSDNHWIMVVAHSPVAVGRVNRLVLHLPSRLIQLATTWSGSYNLGCELVENKAASDCWGLLEMSFCMASAEGDPVPDCLASWPRGAAIVHRVGSLSGSPPSDDLYMFTR